MSPPRPPDLFPGVPLVITGRWSGAKAPSAVTLRGRTADGRDWSTRVPVIGVSRAEGETMTAIWARAHLRDLEDAYAAGATALEREIVGTSLRHSVLCRFTAFVAVDSEVVTQGGAPHRVTQPVELPAGWDLPAGVGYAPVTAMGQAIQLSTLQGVRFSGVPAVARGARGVRAAGRAGGMLARRATRPGAPPAPLPPAVPPEQSATGLPAGVRVRLAEELQRLRAMAAAPEHRRRAWLADLATRLAAMAGDLPDTGAPAPVGDQLRVLARELSACDDTERAPRGADLDRLWRRCEEVLGSLLGTAAAPAPAARRPRTQDFWKAGGTGTDPTAPRE